MSSMIRRVLALPRRSKSLTISWFLLKNLVARHSSITVGGTQSKGLEPREAAAYASSTFDALLDHAGLRAGDLRGRRLLELGPGDNVGLALRFLGAGASQVVCLDRFQIKRATDRERRIYGCILDSLTPVEREQAESVVQVEPELRLHSERLSMLTGLGVEEAAQTHKAITRLAAAPGERSSMGQRGREHVAVRYSATGLVVDLADLDREILQARWACA